MHMISFYLQEMMGGSVMKTVLDGKAANSSQEQITSFVHQALEVR